MSERRVVDEAVLNEARDIMGDAFADLVDAYLAETADLLQDIDDAGQAADTARLASLAHSLKSSSANIGALRLAEAARSLEMGARAGDSKHTALVDAVRAEHTAAAVVLERMRRR